MSEHMLSFEKSLYEISRLAERTLDLLEETDRRPIPVKYLAIVTNAGKLKEMWARHAAVERALFPAAFCPDLDVLENELGFLVSAPWPRSPQAGMRLIRPRAFEALIRVLVHVEQERVAVLPLAAGRIDVADADGNACNGGVRAPISPLGRQTFSIHPGM